MAAAFLASSSFSLASLAAFWYLASVYAFFIKAAASSAAFFASASFYSLSFWAASFSASAFNCASLAYASFASDSLRNFSAAIAAFLLLYCSKAAFSASLCWSRSICWCFYSSIYANSFCLNNSSATLAASFSAYVPPASFFVLSC